MKPKEIAFIIYPVSDIKKGRDFYEKILGFTPENVWMNDTNGTGMVEYALGLNGSHTLAIGSGVEQFKPGKNGAVAAIEVEDFDAALAKLKTTAMTFIMEPIETPVCRMVVFLDPDGNQLMLHARKAK